MKKRSPRYKEGAGVFQSRLPADQRIQQDSVNNATVLENKSPLIESIVLTTFDARPVNGRDFYSSGGTIVAAGVEEAGSPGAFFNYTVPNGYRAILRGYRYFLNPIIIPVNGFIYSEITGRFYVGGLTTLVLQPNGSSVPGFDNLQHGQSQIDYQPCYILADSNEIITLILRFSGAYKAAVPAALTIQIEFYGNIIENTGIPLNFEPGLSKPLPVKVP